MRAGNPPDVKKAPIEERHPIAVEPPYDVAHITFNGP